MGLPQLFGYIMLEALVPVRWATQLALVWVTIQGLSVDAVAKNTVQILRAEKQGLQNCAILCV